MPAAEMRRERAVHCGSCGLRRRRAPVFEAEICGRRGEGLADEAALQDALGGGLFGGGDGGGAHDGVDGKAELGGRGGLGADVAVVGGRRHGRRQDGHGLGGQGHVDDDSGKRNFEGIKFWGKRIKIFSHLRYSIFPPKSSLSL